jgi:hypothetical protein
MIVSIPYLAADGHPESVFADFANCDPRALTPFLAHRDGSKQWWLADADFLWFDGAHVLRFRRGYGWNGASVPAIARWYEAPGDHLAASLPHDHGYGFHWFESWDFGSQRWVGVTCTKAYCDRLWYQILRHHYDLRFTKTCILWQAVHLGGWASWLTGSCTRHCATCVTDTGPGRDCPYRCSLPATYAHWRLTT